MWDAGRFEPQIHHIRFPRFKTLHQGLRIEFDYPITAIVGPNGTNKTSILRALQGCPEGNDLGTYSFGTAMDQIPDGNRDRFIYGRLSKSQGTVVEIIKTRIGRRNSKRSRREIDPDLFEPSRPLLGAPDSMERYPFNKDTAPQDGSATRWKTIDKNVIYLDFRSQLSAFDWAFHHLNVSSSGSTTGTQLQNMRKAKIRSWSPPLARAIGNRLTSDVRYNKEKISRSIRPLRMDELAKVKQILERDYESIEIIRHAYFGNHDGWTAVIHSGNLEYSEAFAGSGEFAVIMLVVEVMNAPDHSLLLLDEPEVSLHPGAQARLMEFLSSMCQKHRHQVVMSTHSREMISRLPAEAVKVLIRRPDNDLVDIVAQAASPQVAFDALGISYDRPTIIVEDRLAQAVVERALQGSTYEKTVTVRYIPGGASSLWTLYIPVWSEEDRANVLLLFDGDQATEVPPSSDSVGPVDLPSVLRMSLNDHEPRLPFGKDEIGAGSKRAEIQRHILDWRRQYVNFLPFLTPERFVWPYRGSNIDDDSAATQSVSDFKAAWVNYTLAELGGTKITGENIYTFQLQALKNVETNDIALVEIRVMVEQFLKSVPT